MTPTPNQSNKLPRWLLILLVLINLGVIGIPWLQGTSQFSVIDLLLGLAKQLLLIPAGFVLTGLLIKRCLDNQFQLEHAYYLGLLMAAVISVQYMRGFV